MSSGKELALRPAALVLRSDGADTHRGAFRTEQEQWGIYYDDDDIDWYDSERGAREALDVARQAQAGDDPELRHAHAGATLVRRQIVTTGSTWRKVVDRY